MEEDWRCKLSTYPPHGLNKKGESNFRRWVLPKMIKPLESVTEVPTPTLGQLGHTSSNNYLVHTPTGNPQANPNNILVDDTSSQVTNHIDLNNATNVGNGTRCEARTGNAPVNNMTSHASENDLNTNGTPSDMPVFGDFSP